MLGITPVNPTSSLIFDTKCASWLLCSKPVQQNLGHLQEVQTEVRELKVRETKVTTKKAFNQDHFGTEGNHETDSDKKNPILGIFSDL